MNTMCPQQQKQLSVKSYLNIPITSSAFDLKDCEVLSLISLGDEDGIDDAIALCNVNDVDQFDNDVFGPVPIDQTQIKIVDSLTMTECLDEAFKNNRESIELVSKFFVDGEDDAMSGPTHVPSAIDVKSIPLICESTNGIKRKDVF